MQGKNGKEHWEVRNSGVKCFNVRVEFTHSQAMVWLDSLTAEPELAYPP